MLQLSCWPMTPSHHWPYPTITQGHTPLVCSWQFAYELKKKQLWLLGDGQKQLPVYCLTDCTTQWASGTTSQSTSHLCMYIRTYVGQEGNYLNQTIIVYNNKLKIMLLWAVCVFWRGYTQQQVAWVSCLSVSVT